MTEDAMKQMLLVAMFYPLIAFCLVGVIEIRSHRTKSEKLRSLAPAVMGVAASGMLFGSSAIWMTPGASVTLSRVMALIALVVACSGAFVPFSRKMSRVWIISGGLVLAFFWLLNRIVA